MKNGEVAHRVYKALDTGAKKMGREKMWVLGGPSFLEDDSLEYNNAESFIFGVDIEGVPCRVTIEPGKF